MRDYLVVVSTHEIKCTEKLSFPFSAHAESTSTVEEDRGVAAAAMGALKKQLPKTSSRLPKAKLNAKDTKATAVKTQKVSKPPPLKQKQLLKKQQQQKIRQSASKSKSHASGWEAEDGDDDGWGGEEDLREDKETGVALDEGEANNGVIEFPGGELEDEDDGEELAGSQAPVKKKSGGGFQTMGLSPAVYKSVSMSGLSIRLSLMKLQQCFARANSYVWDTRRSYTHGFCADLAYTSNLYCCISSAHLPLKSSPPCAHHESSPGRARR
eukprot:6213220-Pleurochrysis_carterae.AAC.3